ncbi:hypothetical protein P153DRAFT_389981 [Dothidotthia symphoricarpi CBS 119687]|uniref:Uncharacterized protein n=1 Tax=Dothidotthia symphoricarpi CBS 119687 TaxID=1392245 RepID=A0A6A6A1T0_9PLEO|nr:uncharacterized protein P153DRAFT_389981 [Dothidotthia symphoricarpi CBS 119687]KAF2125133.1 hypothetical protein P153DRAFT_389981 [Dothidotthia symphoricarpi CBS 119687]
MGFLSETLQHYKPSKEEAVYSSLQDSESDLLPSSKQQTHPRSTPRAKLYSFLAGLLAALAITLISLGILHILTPVPKTAAQIEAEEWNYCGRSSVVAKARGCVMEPLFYGWMPPQCAWKDFSDQWPVFEDRKWYIDVNMTMEIPPQDLWNGKHVMIYTSKYHGEHCLFQWRKLQFALDQKREFLDNKTISAHHTGHCADQLTAGCEGPGDWSEVELGFYRCRKTIW